MKRATPFAPEEEPSTKRQQLLPVLIEPEDQLPVPYTADEVFDLLMEELGNDFNAEVHTRRWMGLLEKNKDRSITFTTFYMGASLWNAHCVCVEQCVYLQTDPWSMPYNHSMVDIALSEARWIDEQQAMTKERFNEWIYLLICDHVNFEAKKKMTQLQKDSWHVSWYEYVKHQQNME